MVSFVPRPFTFSRAARENACGPWKSLKNKCFPIETSQNTPKNARKRPFSSLLSFKVEHPSGGPGGEDGVQHFFVRAHLERGVIAELLRPGDRLEFFAQKAQISRPYGIYIGTLFL